MSKPPHRTPRRALVLGGGGFIGTNVADALRDAGHHVAVTFRGRAPSFHLRGRIDEALRADVGDAATLHAAMRGRDVVVHAAGHYPRFSLDAEATTRRAVREVRTVLDAAREARVPRLVFTSSIATLGPDGAVAPSVPTDSAYRMAKWHMERAVAAARADGLDVVTLRPGGCLGPWDLRVGTGGVIVALIRGALPWIVDGQVYLVDVRDVAQAHVAAMQPSARASYDLAGHGVTVADLAARVTRSFGGAAVPVVLSPEAARARADDDERRALATGGRAPLPREFVDIALAHLGVDDGPAARDLGFRPRPLDEALRDAVAWFRRTRHLPPPDSTEKLHP
jgi:dihydroflavonol-4-reductase